MNREKLINKIKALKAMTAAAGCTEAEAMSAAEKAAALMAEHAISDEILEIRDQSVPVKTGLKSSRAKIWAYIAHVTNCAILHSKYVRSGGYSLVFVGCEPGPEIACYLREVCDRAIDRAVAEFKQGKFYKGRRSTSTRRKAVEDFTVAMIYRLGTRLIEMFQASISDQQFEKARAALDLLFPNTEAVDQKQHKARFRDASHEGHRAGQNVHLAHGVNGNKPVALIGGGK